MQWDFCRILRTESVCNNSRIPCVVPCETIAKFHIMFRLMVRIFHLVRKSCKEVSRYFDTKFDYFSFRLFYEITHSQILQKLIRENKMMREEKIKRENL